MNEVLKGFVFFIGWVLSPFTWWNDIFINVPLSYIIANILFGISHFQFGELMIASYWFTNVIGLFFMYFGGRSIISSSKKKVQATLAMVTALLIYSAIMIYLSKQGKLLPLQTYFEKYLLITK